LTVFGTPRRSGSALFGERVPSSTSWKIIDAGIPLLCAFTTPALFATVVDAFNSH
jgi:hypothetical protein